MNNLDKAINILKRKGWIKGQSVSAEGVCLGQACSMAAVGDHQYTVLKSILHEEYGTYLIVDANDKWMQSIEEPLEMLRRASLRYDNAK